MADMDDATQTKRLREFEALNEKFRQAHEEDDGTAYDAIDEMEAYVNDLKDQLGGED